MARPSGECEGQPCYTDDDFLEIQAEIDVLNTEIADLNGQKATIDTQIAMKQQQIGELNTENFFANMNRCPE